MKEPRRSSGGTTVQRDPSPWRETGDPYKIWISGEMTIRLNPDFTGRRVLPEVDRAFFRRQKPCRGRYGRAAQGVGGLPGYYSRARNLQKAAKQLTESGSNSLPGDYFKLLALPEWAYAAGAVASIAFGIPVPAIDANGRRVFSPSRPGRTDGQACRGTGDQRHLLLHDP